VAAISPRWSRNRGHGSRSGIGSRRGLGYPYRSCRPRAGSAWPHAGTLAGDRSM